MRDPERRERILRLLTDIWMREENADLRLLQLVINAVNASDDPYWYEDAKLEVALEIYGGRLNDQG